MRPSNKTTILKAAIQVIETEGITAVTFDSVAAVAGLTRGGVLYHFPSREDLVGAIHTYMAEQWELELERRCGKSASEATVTERLIAYIRVCATSATTGELQMLLDSPNSEAHKAWSQVLERWTPHRNADGTSAVRDELWTALLAADGLWINEAVSQKFLPHGKRTQIAEQIVDLVRRTETGSADA